MASQTNFAVGNQMKLSMSVGSIEFINHYLTMELSVRHFRNDGFAYGSGGQLSLI